MRKPPVQLQRFSIQYHMGPKMSGNVITPEQDIRILLHSRVQAVVCLRVAERLIQSQPLVLMGGDMRLLHVDVRCIITLYMPIVGKNLVQQQPVDVVSMQFAVAVRHSGHQPLVRAPR